MKNILVLAAAILIGITLHSCGGKNKPPKPGSKEQQFKTTARIELSDGRVLEGTEIRIGGNNSYYTEDKYMLMSVKGLEGKDERSIQVWVGFDANNNLLPLGAKLSGIGGESIMSIMFTDVNTALFSEKNIGSHSISNLVLHPNRVPNLGIDYPTFRYEFSGVVLTNQSGSGDVTASGFIQCVVD